MIPARSKGYSLGGLGVAASARMRRPQFGLAPRRSPLKLRIPVLECHQVSTRQ